MKNLRHIDMGLFSFGIKNGRELTKLEHLEEVAHRLQLNVRRQGVGI
jgi:hypothetical protein